MHVVSNPSADRDEKLEHAAKILHASPQARSVFKLVYTGSRQFKTIGDMKEHIPGFNTRTYQAANRLAAENILEKRTSKGKDSYHKIDFYAHNRDHILRLSKNQKRLQTFPTKRRSGNSAAKMSFSFFTKPQVEQIQIDDVDSFNKVKLIAAGDVSIVRGMAERVINAGICKILRQEEKKDWGGENNDIFSTKLVLKSRRIPAAFALKGKGTKGKLTPGKMGKNGDQIIRLFLGTSQIYFVVHNDTIHEAVFDLMQTHAIEKSIQTGKKIYYCLVDVGDLSRLVAAYPDKFK